MKRIIVYVILTVLVAVAHADVWIKDAEPAILEVHYTRTEVYDTTMRASRFFKDPVMLRIGKNKSIFCGTKQLWQDSILAVDPATFWEMDRARIMSENRDDTQLTCGHYHSYIYKNIPEGKVTERSYFDLEHWQYTEDWEKPEWELGKGIKTILGYECTKATTNFHGRDWTVWFSPEIPLQTGPWKLSGLPGMIMETWCVGNQYGFNATGIEKTNKPIRGVYLSTDYEKTTREDFLRMKRKYIDNPMGNLKSQHGSTPVIFIDNDGTVSQSIEYLPRNEVDFIETDY